MGEETEGGSSSRIRVRRTRKARDGARSLTFRLATSFAPVEHSKSLTSSLRRYDGPFSWLSIAGPDQLGAGGGGRGAASHASRFELLLHF